MKFDAEKLAEWCGGRWEGGTPDAVEGISNSTRTIQPGELYVAIRGQRLDGHRFVAEAFRAGAAAAMVEHNADFEVPFGSPLLRVEDCVDALGALAAGWRQALAPVVIGVTGSVGKTTVKEMLLAVLGAEHKVSGTRGNWNNEIGLPLSMLAMPEATEIGVFEAGMNHPGEIAVLSDLMVPQWGVVTAIGPVHIEFFESEEAIAREKAAMLRGLPQNGHAVLCCDEKFYGVLRQGLSCAVHTVSLQAAAADYFVSIRDVAGKLLVRERSSGDEQLFGWGLPGDHNALNAAYAIAVARGIGLGWDAIRRGLAAYQPPAMRWQLEQVAGLTFVNDAYNANPLSMRAALAAFNELDVVGRKWLVLGDMLELGAIAESEHIALGKLVAQGDWQGVAAVGTFATQIVSGLQAGGFSGAIACCEKSTEAAAILHEWAEHGDGVLLKASRGVALENVIGELVKLTE